MKKSKSNSLERLIFGLGIKQVGKKMAKTLAEKYLNLDNLMNASEEELLQIKDVGSVIAKSIVEFFDNEKNINMINKLIEIGLNTSYLGQKIITTNSDISDKTFVITGTLSRSRNKIKEELESFGAKVTDSVTSKTDVLIVGSEAGSKLDKAKKLNITIWDEEKLNEMIQKAA